MLRSRIVTCSILFMMIALISASMATAQDEGEFAIAELDSFQSVPAIVSPAEGEFFGLIDPDSTELIYVLVYDNTRGAVSQIHIHVGQAGVSGGVGVFLCSNLGNGPEGTQPCPEFTGELFGTLTVDDVVGPVAQGVGTGAFGFKRFLKALRNGAGYINVHTDQYPGGELRGQIEVINLTP